MSKSPSLRRIKADIRELSIDPSDQYYAAPLETDMFEWHFTIRGPADSEFAGGVYHGKILLPPEYPFKPPNIVFCTPSGRFETNVKVCLSFSAHHPELWQPAWGIRLILEAIISFLPTPADGAIGALDWTKEERAKLAKESVKFHCPVCCAVGQSCAELLPDIPPAADEKSEDNGNNDKKKKTSKFQEEIEKLKMLQGMHHAKEEEEDDDVADSGGESKEEAKETEQGGSTSIDETSQLLPSVTEDGADTCASESQETKPKPIEEANDNAKPAPLPDQNPPDQSSSEPSDMNPALEQSTPDNATESPTTTNVTSAAGAGAETSAGNQTSDAVAPPAINNQGNIPAASPQHSILVTEPFLNGMILAFSVTVMYLLTQAYYLLEELNVLNTVNK
ncbi:ubiquitin-conjugating enzyme E2 [Skeletonema marinoi]|uniref:Ubiquitin-conjugating enzyme E2 n=1 Tax=Skeletonema marinoi TaxID=267567 RepID=A0AAD8YB68_9STRA|nr:ubiquitin-conjugating enzyme E2 [Skeletonema marinoi]